MLNLVVAFVAVAFTAAAVGLWRLGIAWRFFAAAVPSVALWVTVAWLTFNA